MNRRPRVRIVAPAASPEEAAAVAVALERFMRDTAPTPAPPPARTPPSGWARAARREAIGLDGGEPAGWGGAGPGSHRS